MDVTWLSGKLQPIQHYQETSGICLKPAFFMHLLLLLRFVRLLLDMGLVPDSQRKTVSLTIQKNQYWTLDYPVSSNNKHLAVTLCPAFSPQLLECVCELVYVVSWSEVSLLTILLTNLLKSISPFSCTGAQG